MFKTKADYQAGFMIIKKENEIIKKSNELKRYDIAVILKTVKIPCENPAAFHVNKMNKKADVDSEELKNKLVDNDKILIVEESNSGKENNYKRIDIAQVFNTSLRTQKPQEDVMRAILPLHGIYEFNNKNIIIFENGKMI